MAESTIPASVHSRAAGVCEAGVVEEATMREPDALCRTSVEPLTREEIQAVRAREQVSQSAFAHYRNVRTDAVNKWEPGKSGRVDRYSRCSLS